MTVPDGYGTPTFQEAEVNGLPAVQALAASTQLLRDAAQNQAFAGQVLSGDQGTALAVFKTSTNAAAIWGTHTDTAEAGYVAASGMRSYVNDGGANVAYATYSAGTFAIHTWHLAGGTLYSGINDTRTTSMSSVSTGSYSCGCFLVILGSSGPGRYLDGELAELIFYATALPEADRKLTEQYLAGKYGITLPY